MMLCVSESSPFTINLSTGICASCDSHCVQMTVLYPPLTSVVGRDSFEALSQMMSGTQPVDATGDNRGNLQRMLSLVSGKSLALL